MRVIVLPMLCEDGHLVWRIWNRNKGSYYSFHVPSPVNCRVLHAYVSIV